MLIAGLTGASSRGGDAAALWINSIEANAAPVIGAAARRSVLRMYISSPFPRSALYAAAADALHPQGAAGRPQGRPHGLLSAASQSSHTFVGLSVGV